MFVENNLYVCSIIEYLILDILNRSSKDARFNLNNEDKQILIYSKRTSNELIIPELMNY